MARELKPVSFNSDTKADREMLEYIEELGVSFGSYVKLLIRKDMRAGSTVIETNNETGEIASQLRELVSIFKAGNISLGARVSNETAISVMEPDEPEETEEQRKQREAMEKLLGM